MAFIVKEDDGRYTVKVNRDELQHILDSMTWSDFPFVLNDRQSDARNDLYVPISSILKEK